MRMPRIICECEINTGDPTLRNTNAQILRSGCSPNRQTGRNSVQPHAVGTTRCMNSQNWRWQRPHTLGCQPHTQQSLQRRPKYSRNCSQWSALPACTASRSCQHKSLEGACRCYRCSRSGHMNLSKRATKTMSCRYRSQESSMQRQGPVLACRG